MKLPFLKSIILVDDDEISNLFNKIFIKKLNIDTSVDVFLNGKEALDYLVNHKGDTIDPCLLLLDIKMPVMDGWGFLKRYSEVFPEHIKKQVTIVVLTTSEDECDLVKAMENPDVKEFIRKPLSEEVFTQLIDKHYTVPLSI